MKLEFFILIFSMIHFSSNNLITQSNLNRIVTTTQAIKQEPTHSIKQEPNQDPEPGELHQARTEPKKVVKRIFAVANAILTAPSAENHCQTIQEFDVLNNYAYDCSDHSLHINFEIDMYNGSKVEANGYLYEGSDRIYEKLKIFTWCKKIRK